MSQYQRTPTLPQVLEASREASKRQIRVALPCQVISYDPLTQTADVQPLVDDWAEQPDGTFAPAPFAALPHVPVAFPGAGGFRITFPVQPGDTGQIICNDLSMDLWQQQGGHVSPSDRRRHHLSDAVFYPGLHPDNAPWGTAGSSSLTVGADAGPQAVFRSGGIELGSNEAVAPVDFLVKGTTYRAAEDVMLTALGAAQAAVATALATAATQLGVAGANLISTPPTAAAALIAAGGGLAGAAGALAAFATALTAFESAALDYLSVIVKTA